METAVGLTAKFVSKPRVSAGKPSAGELLAVHLRQAAKAHVQLGDTDWAQRAVSEVMDLLSGDPGGLIVVMGAIGDADIFE